MATKPAFVTGATGFIGRYLVPLLARRSDTIYALVREGSLDRLGERIEEWGLDGQVIPVIGDLTQPYLGVSDEVRQELRDQIGNFFHLAAIYDVTAGASEQFETNVEGTRRAVRLAEAIEAERFNLASSIAVAGLYKGLWREDMFDEAERLDNNPYFRTKHESEAIVRNDCTIPWRVYRPGIVVGSSKTGEMDKIDGPYYFFKLIQKIRDRLPKWVPIVGVEGRPINLVPVDFVAAAMDELASQDGLDGQAFHLTDPNAQSVGKVMNIFADAAHAPKFSMRIDPAMAGFVPGSVKKAIQMLPPVRHMRENTLSSLGIPDEVLTYIDYPTTFDSRDTQRALAGTGIEVPPLADYAWRLWDYWERHLDPDLFKDRSLAGAVGGKTVMITGASSGIGREVALEVGKAGGTVLLVARTKSKLDELADEIIRAGGTAFSLPCDLTDMDDIDRMADEALAQFGSVDVLVNNAGRSIRRSVALSYDRFHDFERTMTLNYFGAVRLILKVLPVMREKGNTGHIINVSSIGVQTNTPRFSAYVASKSALDAFSRCIASEIVDDKVNITTVHMPLVRTPMIAPTKIYDAFPTISPSEAAEMITRAMIERPKRVATRLGNTGQILYAISPKLVDSVMNTAYKLFPDSAAAKGEDTATDTKPSDEAVAFAYIMRGVHW